MMNTAQKALIANVVGIFVLLLAGKGITVDEQTAKQIMEGLAALGLVINQVLHWLEAKKTQ